MISFDRFERSLPALLDDLAAPRLPDYADDLFARTAATRQRSGWTFPERWLPMSAITRRLAAAPNIPWRLGVLVALLAIAVLMAALVAGALFNRGPAPYGPAANGQIVYVDDAGRIVIGDPTTETSRVIAEISGGLNPLFSQGGNRIAFLRATGATGRFDVNVVNADGSGLTTVSPEAIPTPGYLGWSPDGNRLLVLDWNKRILVYDANTVAEPFSLSEALGVPVWSVGHGYNYRSTFAFRPPNGEEILFVTGTSEEALGAARLDGTGWRPLFDRETSDVDYLAVIGAEWSPDGSRLVMMLETTRDNLQPFLLNSDGTGFRSLKADLFDDPLVNINSPLWSPDGTRVAFQYWTRDAGSPDQEFHPIAIVDVATGKFTDVGPTLINGASWQWSPDGKYILEVPGDGSGEILIIDAEKGTWDKAPWLVDQPVDWQRVAS